MLLLGPFELTITSPGLASQDFSGNLSPGEAYVTPIILLAIATQVTEVHVGLTPDEIAEVQMKDQEKQRVLGFIPNFYVSYVPNAAPLSSKRRFRNSPGRPPAILSRSPPSGSWLA